MSDLAALFERLKKLEEEVLRGLDPRAAEDEGTKLLQAADNLQLQGAERARRRELVRGVNALLEPPPQRKRLLELTDGRSAVDELQAAADHLLAELAWVARLTLQAIANDEDAYLFSIIPHLSKLEEFDLVRKLREWASSAQSPRCEDLVRRIDELAVVMELSIESLNRPAECTAFVRRASDVYSKLLKSMEGPQEEVFQLMEELRREREEVKSDISFLKDRLQYLKKRYRILRCLAPTVADAQLMAAKELRLCLQIHRLPDRGFVDKQDIVNQLSSAGVLRA